jgi:putative ABC transport system permease protein
MLRVPNSRYLLSVLGVVSISVLLMAWVNYINMTLSANQKRMKELAARKAVGANYIDFILQFIIEAMLLNGVALLVAITLIQLIRTPAQVYFGFYVVSWSDISLTVKLLISCAIFAGITITGMYPAIATLNVSPKVLFGEKRLAKRSFRFSHLLTVFQYVAAMALIIWALSVYLQITHVLNFDIGVKKDQVVVIDLPVHQDSMIRSQVKYFEGQLSSSSSIMDYTFSHDVIGDRDNKYLKRNDRSEAFMMEAYTVDARFIPFYGIKLIAGRNFLSNHRADENTIILSRKAIRTLGFTNPEDALGAQILVPQDLAGFSDYAPSTVIGVFEDYFTDPFFTIYQGYTSGMSLFPSSFDATLRKVSVRIFPGQFKNAMGQLQGEYASVFPHTIFNSNFLEEQISRAYNEEKKVSNQIILFTLIAIGIACLGLLGMMSHKAVEKTKEIGIRKILGARLSNIALIMLKSTVNQILIALIIALPVAYYLVWQYLQKYTEQITLQWWHFALPVLILIVILLATIASVLWRAAEGNPVEALKYE